MYTCVYACADIQTPHTHTLTHTHTSTPSSCTHIPLFPPTHPHRPPPVQVRISAGESLCRVTRLLRPEDRGKHALTLVLQLAHDDEQEELRMTAVWQSGSLGCVLLVGWLAGWLVGWLCVYIRTNDLCIHHDTTPTTP